MKTYRLSAHIDAHNILDVHKKLKELSALMPTVEFHVHDNMGEWVMSIRGKQSHFYRNVSCSIDTSSPSANYNATI